MRDPRDSAHRDRRARPDGRLARTGRARARRRREGRRLRSRRGRAGRRTRARLRRRGGGRPRGGGGGCGARRAVRARRRAPGACSRKLAELAPDATITDIGSTKAGVVAAVPRIAARPLHRRPPDLRHGDARRPERACRAVRRRDLVPDAADREASPSACATCTGCSPRSARRPSPSTRECTTACSLVTSDLPHALANMLVVQAGEARIDGHDPLTEVGGSFRDMTRWPARTRASGSTSSSTTARRSPASCASTSARSARCWWRSKQATRATSRAGSARRRGTAGARWRRSSTSGRRSSTACRSHLRPPRQRSPASPRLGAARINIEDFEFHHYTPERGGTIELLVAGQDAAERAVELLDARAMARSRRPSWRMRREHRDRIGPPRRAPCRRARRRDRRTWRQVDLASLAPDRGGLRRHDRGHGLRRQCRYARRPRRRRGAGRARRAPRRGCHPPARPRLRAARAARAGRDQSTCRTPAC